MQDGKHILTDFTFRPFSPLAAGNLSSSVNSRRSFTSTFTGIVRNQGQKLILINGMPDHIHILIGLKPAMALADLGREIKADSSNFVNERKFIHGRFSWQEGYGAFSYGHSQLDTVIRYIRNQEKHHSRSSFRAEYLTLLRKFDVAFEEKYVFEFIE